MKFLSKPLSSPSRAEKFPPPLMRFLRSNMGSRSRGRSRSSPIFYLRNKKRPPGGVVETTQEPSSPKVTCIGQVRVRRKKKGAAALSRRRCRRWLNKIVLCGKFSSRFSEKPLGKFFCRWGFVFRSNCCREVGVAEEDNFRVCSDQKSGEIENYVVAGDNNKNSSKMEFLEPSPPSSPPKNALLLTRCRSAPYRSSSLGGRFWAEEKGEIINGNENEEERTEELEKPRCEENSKEMEKIFEDLKKENNKGIAVHPLLLTRCKSEPARKGERLIVNVNNAEESASFLMQRRLDVIQPCLQHK